LGGIHLGAVERRALLALADKVPPAPTAETRSAREVLRRALVRLAELGLVRKGARLALTRLGQHVVEQFRQGLQDGKRIRWERGA
jgi:hypothetical protein